MNCPKCGKPMTPGRLENASTETFFGLFTPSQKGGSKEEVNFLAGDRCDAFVCDHCKIVVTQFSCD